MNLRALARDLPLYLKASRIVTEIRLQAALRQSLLMMFSAAIAVMALVFLNLALYQALVQLWGSIWTPAFLAAVNLVLALLVAFLASRAMPKKEIEMAEDLRASAQAALQEDLAADSGGLGLAGGDSLRHIIPIMSLILGALRKARKPESK